MITLEKTFEVDLVDLVMCGSSEELVVLLGERTAEDEEGGAYLALETLDYTLDGTENGNGGRVRFCVRAKYTRVPSDSQSYVRNAHSSVGGELE